MKDNLGNKLEQEKGYADFFFAVDWYEKWVNSNLQDSLFKLYCSHAPFYLGMVLSKFNKDGNQI